VSGRNPGGGDHRGSIFRRHVGSALLATGSWPVDVQNSWLRQRAASNEKAAEEPLERAVTACIGAMPLLWLAVPDRSQRHTIESSAIALLSQLAGGIDPASPDWLGRHATNLKVRTSGLWNSNHVNDLYQPSFLDDMTACLTADAVHPSVLFDAHGGGDPYGLGQRATRKRGHHGAA
jgi:hypothetical protein